MLRVLHVLAETGWSGGESQLEHLVRHLHAAGHHNALAVPAAAAFRRVGEELGLPVADVNLRRPVRSGGMLALRRTVAELEPDVVHFGCGRSLLWGGLALRSLRAPVKVTTRRIDYPIGRGSLSGGRYRTLVDHVIANCEAVRARVLDAGVPDVSVTLIHEGIDVAPWLDARAERGAARARLGLPADAKVVCQAATLRPRKGQRVLIAAFERLLSRHPNTVLVLAGEGSDLDALRALAGKKGLGERIRIPGAIRPVRDLYAASDIGVMASHHEGLSNACLEQTAAGLPLVVSNVGGLPEIVADRVTGFVVEPGDIAGFENRIGMLLDDDDLRARFGEAGRRRTVERFTADRMARRTEELLLALCAAPRPASGRASERRTDSTA